MSISVSLAVLGSDMVGLSVAKKLVEENNPDHLGLIGTPPTSDQISNLITITEEDEKTFEKRFPKSLLQSDDLRTTVQTVSQNLQNQLGFFGGQIVDLEVSNAGFSFLVRVENDELFTLHSRHLLVSAPPLLDIIDKASYLPGMDSSVFGLLIERTGLNLNFSKETYQLGPEMENLWDFDFGFQCDSDGTTSNMRIFTCGQSAQGPTSAENLKNLIDQIGSLGEPYTFQKNSFDPEGWQDAEMPEGFVETKIERIREIVYQLLKNPSEKIIQELEGVAGEVDSYSRFRSDPDLQRLRWKTLTIMNFVRPYLSENTVNA